MSKLRIGLDCDDTISAFMQPYLDKFGTPKNDFEITRNVYKLRTDKDFWMNVPVIHYPDFTPTLFCSKRIHPKSWSKKYLSDKLGFSESIPFYQLYGQHLSKSRWVKGKVDVFIDDSISNFKELNSAGVPCLLIDSEWNRHFETPLRIYSLSYEEIEYKFNSHFND